MIRQVTPTWVYGGAFSLSTIAGSVNAITWLGVEHKGITHVTGTLTNISTQLASHQVSLALHGSVIVIAFFGGAIISGVLIQSPSLKWGRRYGVGLMLEGSLLLCAYLARSN